MLNKRLLFITKICHKHNVGFSSSGILHDLTTGQTLKKVIWNGKEYYMRKGTDKRIAVKSIEANLEHKRIVIEIKLPF